MNILYLRSIAFSFLIVFLFHFTTTLWANPLTKEQLFQLGMLAVKQEEYQHGIDLFQKVIDLDPKFSPAYHGMGLVYLHQPQQDLNAAIRYFKIAVSLSKEHTESWNNLGQAYYLIGRFSLAKEAFLESLKINPQQHQLHITLAWIYLLGESRPELAIEEFKIAKEAFEDNASILYGLGLAYLLQEDRYKVLDVITLLRKKQYTQEALKLENMIKGNIRLVSKEGMPLVTGDDQYKSLFDTELKALEQKGFYGQDATGSIKVRLKGPLPQY